MDLRQVDAVELDLVDWAAAVQHVLMKPTPHTLPASPGIYGQCVEDHRNAGQAAEGRLVLRTAPGDWKALPKF